MIGALREPANALTHLAGSVLALAGFIVLLWLGIGTGSVLAATALVIYGLSQLALYVASTLHHALRVTGGAYDRLLRLDCVMVFIFIAGTYTPVCLIALQHGWRWGLLGAVWSIALGGLVMKVFWLHGPVWFSTALYVAMGWIALAAMPTLVHSVPAGGIHWFIAGGVVYTVGALIYLFDEWRPHIGSVQIHPIWHLFVVGGSACFFWAIVRYVTPLA